MKSRIFSICLLFSVVFVFTGCNKSKQEAPVTENKQNEVKTGEVVKINLPTMQCATCKKNIETALKKVDGVTDANVVVKEKIVNVNFDKSKTNLDKIETAITAAGYDANGKKKDEAAYEKLADCCKIGGHD